MRLPEDSGSPFVCSSVIHNNRMPTKRVFYYLSLNLNDFALVVRTAGLADSVRHHQCAAFAALHQSGCAHFPICPSLISSGLGRLILRTDRHRYTSLFALKTSMIAAILGSGTKVSQPHAPVIKSFPQTGHSHLQSGLHNTFIGQLVVISLSIRLSIFSE